jgi:hypothetical protein
MSAREAATRLWRWTTSEPKNLVTVLTVPLVVGESVAEIRWHRAARRRGAAPRGLLAYARERPVRFAYSVGLSLLPDLVGYVFRGRRQNRGMSVRFTR